jgi:hypothetical protein
MITGYETSSRTQLHIRRGDAIFLPQGFTRVKVVQGIAWLSVNGRDIVLERGEQIAVEGDVVISGLQDRDVVVEASGVAARAA